MSVSLTFEDLMLQVAGLIRNNAMHRRRELKLQDATIATCTNHIIEEAVEIQAAALDPRCLNAPSPARTALIEEIGDLLGVLCHLMVMANIPAKSVMQWEANKLERIFIVAAPSLTEGPKP